MAFFYAKAGGVATGDAGRATTARTGSYASMGTSAYYSDVNDITSGTPTTPLAAGDSIYLSDIHDSNYSANTVLTFPGLHVNAPVQVISCDDTAVETYKAGALEADDGGTNVDIIMSGRVVFWGVDFHCSDDFLFSNVRGTHVEINNSTITFQSSGDKFITNRDGCSLILNDVIVTGAGDHSVQLVQGASIEVVGGTWSTSGTWSSIINNFSGGGGGFTIKFTGTGLSTLTGFLFEDLGAGTTEDQIHIALEACKLGTINFLEETFHAPNQTYRATNCSGVAAEAEYQYFWETWAGDVQQEDEGGIVRTDDQDGAANGDGYTGGVVVGLRATPNSACSPDRPLIFDFPGNFVKLSAAATDTVTLFIAVDDGTTLTDADFYIEVMNPNNTTKNQFDLASSAPQLSGTHTLNPLASGTTLTTDAGSTWEDNGVALTGHNEYKLSLTIVGGADSVPLIRVFITKPVSTGVFIDQVFGIGAG